MGWFSIDILCGDCNERSAIIIERSSVNDAQVCELCGGKAERVISALHKTKQSFVDGTKRKGWSDLKQASKIEGEMFSKPHDKRQKHQAEIDKLRSLKK